MAKKKNEEKEIEEVKKPVDKEKWVTYYEENIKEDIEDIEMIAKSANEVIRRNFDIEIEDNRLTTVIFLKTFESIIKKLKEKERDYNSFKINLANRLEVGYTNNNNDDDEKSGNFMIYMKHLHDASKSESTDDPTAGAAEKTVNWNTENIQEQPEIIRKISLMTAEALRAIEIQLSNGEIVMPIFITYYEAIVNYLHIRRRELDEFEIVINYVWVKFVCREAADEEDEKEGKIGDTILLAPTIASKLALKDDASASSMDE
jgi:hypothetical protein